MTPSARWVRTLREQDPTQPEAPTATPVLQALLVSGLGKVLVRPLAQVQVQAQMQAQTVPGPAAAWFPEPRLHVARCSARQRSPTQQQARATELLGAAARLRMAGCPLTCQWAISRLAWSEFSLSDSGPCECTGLGTAGHCAGVHTALGSSRPPNWRRIPS